MKPKLFLYSSKLDSRISYIVHCTLYTVVQEEKVYECKYYILSRHRKERAAHSLGSFCWRVRRESCGKKNLEEGDRK